MNKKQPAERDICTKHVTSALEKAGVVVHTDRPDGSIRFVSKGQKVAFGRHVVPTSAQACSEVFLPMDECIKSKCPAGAGSGEVVP